MEQSWRRRVAGEARVFVWAVLAVSALHGTALERSVNIEHDGHDGVGVVHQPGSRRIGTVVDTHRLPRQPQCLEAERCLVVLPPLRAPRAPPVGKVALEDDAEEVLDKQVQTRVEQLGWLGALEVVFDWIVLEVVTKRFRR